MTVISAIDKKQQTPYGILFAFVFLEKYRRYNFSGHVLFELEKNLFAASSMFVETMFHLLYLLTASENIFQSRSDAQETPLAFSRSHRNVFQILLAVIIGHTCQNFQKKWPHKSPILYPLKYKTTVTRT